MKISSKNIGKILVWLFVLMGALTFVFFEDVVELGSKLRGQVTMIDSDNCDAYEEPTRTMCHDSNTALKKRAAEEDAEWNAEIRNFLANRREQENLNNTEENPFQENEHPSSKNYISGAKLSIMAAAMAREKAAREAAANWDYDTQTKLLTWELLPSQADLDKAKKQIKEANPQFTYENSWAGASTAGIVLATTSDSTEQSGAWNDPVAGTRTVRNDSDYSEKLNSSAGDTDDRAEGWSTTTWGTEIRYKEAPTVSGLLPSVREANEGRLVKKNWEMVVAPDYYKDRTLDFSNRYWDSNGLLVVPNQNWAFAEATEYITREDGIVFKLSDQGVYEQTNLDTGSSNFYRPESQIAKVVTPSASKSEEPETYVDSSGAIRNVSELSKEQGVTTDQVAQSGKRVDGKDVTSDPDTWEPLLVDVAGKNYEVGYPNPDWQYPLKDPNGNVVGVYQDGKVLTGGNYIAAQAENAASAEEGWNAAATRSAAEQALSAAKQATALAKEATKNAEDALAKGFSEEAEKFKVQAERFLEQAEQAEKVAEELTAKAIKTKNGFEEGLTSREIKSEVKNEGNITTTTWIKGNEGFENALDYDWKILDIYDFTDDPAGGDFQYIQTKGDNAEIIWVYDPTSEKLLLNQDYEPIIDTDTLSLGDYSKDFSYWEEVIENNKTEETDSENVIKSNNKNEKSDARSFSLKNAGMQPGYSTSVESLLETFINYMALVITIIAIIWIMVGWVVLMTAYGQDEQIQKGKSIILYSILGLIFTITSYAIVSFVQTIVYSVAE